MILFLTCLSVDILVGFRSLRRPHQHLHEHASKGPNVVRTGRSKAAALLRGEMGHHAFRLGGPTACLFVVIYEFCTALVCELESVCVFFEYEDIRGLDSVVRSGYTCSWIVYVSQRFRKTTDLLAKPVFSSFGLAR
jgi:hypothetical protein